MAVLTTSSHLSPPVSVKPSASMQPEDSIYGQLAAIHLPDKEINDILNLHESLTLQEIVGCFDITTDKLINWLQTAQMAVFTLELNAKEPTQDMQDTRSLLMFSFERMEPLVSILEEIAAVVLDKLEEDDDLYTKEKKMRTRMTITKIQSEWSSLQHFLTSVTRQLDTMNEKKELLVLMEKVLQQIDDLSITMFQFQEKRHAAAANTATMTAVNPSSATPSVADSEPTDSSSPLSTASSSIFSPSSTTTTTTTTATTMTTNGSMMLVDPPRDGQILAEIDSRVEPLFNAVQKIYASMTTSAALEDSAGTLARRHQTVQRRWEALRLEIDDLKEELKEDRWLTVFRQVADQVEVMIDGLNKTVAQCHNVIQQVREWHAAATAEQSPPSSRGSTNNGNPLDRLSKTIMRNLSRSHQQQHPLSHTSSPPPIDREKLRSIEKNFEAKSKYYAPSIDKLLGMLGDNIVSRVARDNGIARRHGSIMQRWATLKETIDELRNHELPEADRLLHGGNGGGILEKGGWKNIRYKTPEPGERRINTLPKMSSINGRFMDEQRRGGARSITPNGLAELRSKMYSPSRPPPRAASSMACRPMQDVRPSNSESSSLDGHQRQQQQQQRQRLTKTPSRGDLRPTSHKSKSVNVRKSRVPRTETPTQEASWMKPTKSTIMRNRRAQDEDQGVPARPKTPVTRPKTPTSGNSQQSRKTITPSRPRSSLGHLQPPSPPESHHHFLSRPDRDRAVSPVRRTMTPSFIPRPKTPQHTNSPSLIPRPRSSMMMSAPFPPGAGIHRNTSPPPSPKAYLVRKKQSMPAVLSPLPSASNEVYRANPRDPLDMEVARIVNASPIAVKCQKGPLGGGRYYFGNELNPSVGGGKKLYTCKLMTYGDRDSSRQRSGKPPQNKVLVRVGGGWQDLEIFLLDHSSLMTASAADIVRRPYSSLGYK